MYRVFVVEAGVSVGSPGILLFFMKEHFLQDQSTSKVFNVILITLSLAIYTPIVQFWNVR